MKSDSVIIERVKGAADAFSPPTADHDDELWRVVGVSGGEPPCLVAGKRAAVDLALSRLDGTGGELYIRPEPTPIQSRSTPPVPDEAPQQPGATPTARPARSRPCRS